MDDHLPTDSLLAATAGLQRRHSFPDGETVEPAMMAALASGKRQHAHSQ
jgi:hypothetical protein